MLSRVHARSWVGLLLSVATALGCSERTPQAVRLRTEPGSAGAEHAPPALPTPRARDASFRRGVTLGPLIAPASTEALKRSLSKRLGHAVSLGATDVQLVVRWTQTQLDAVELAPFDSIDDPTLGWLIDAARRRKLRVLLAPSVAVESTEGARPAAALTPASWDRWWWSYRRFVLHYARLAAARKVPVMAVGCGLTSTEPQAQRWRALVAEVREVYAGELTYLASGDSFERVPFWDALDVAGLAVAQPEGAMTHERQLAQLAPLARGLEAATLTRERGYLLSEPVPGQEPLDPEVTLRQRRALLQSFGDDELLRGVFMNDTSDANAKRRLPAAEVVRHWFQKSKR